MTERKPADEWKKREKDRQTGNRWMENRQKDRETSN
jgi:hypothetical protein